MFSAQARALGGAVRGGREGVEEDREQKNEGVKIVEGVAIFGK